MSGRGNTWLYGGICLVAGVGGGWVHYAYNGAPAHYCVIAAIFMLAGGVILGLWYDSIENREDAKLNRQIEEKIRQNPDIYGTPKQPKSN